MQLLNMDLMKNGGLLLSSDVLTMISDLVHESSYPTLFRVCKAWNVSLKQHFFCLQPAVFSGLCRNTFGRVTHLSAPLQRSKFDGALMSFVLLGDDACEDWFPELQIVDLRGQTLSSQIVLVIKRTPYLLALNLSCCNVNLHAVGDLLTNLHSLKHLGIADLHLQRNGISTVELEAEKFRIFSTLIKLASLQSLHMDIGLPSQGAAPLLTLSGHALNSLSGLSSLQILSIHGQHLNHDDLGSLGQLSQLKSLSMDWWVGEPYRASLAPALNAENPGLSYSRFSWMHLMRLTELTSLRVLTYTYRDRMGHTHSSEFDTMTVAPLSKLRRLALPGCFSLSLVLSISKLGGSLQELDLSYAWPHVSPHAVVQVCSKLPCLSALDVSHAQWANPFRQFTSPGDIVMSGLQVFCPQLLTLRMLGVHTHGTGLCEGPLPGGPPGLPGLKELAVDGGLLLRSRVRELGLLTDLRRLTLNNVSSEEFLAATRVGAYLTMSNLTALSALRILAPHSQYLGREVGALLVPGPPIFIEDLDDVPIPEEGEPVEDGWVPIEHLPVPATNALQSGPVPLSDASTVLQENAGPSTSSSIHSLSHEPHLQFASMLPLLQTLVITSLQSEGHCLRHLTGLAALRVLHLGGCFDFTQGGLASLKTLHLPSLQSLQIMTCSFENSLVEVPGSSSIESVDCPHIRLRCSQGLRQLLATLATTGPVLEHLEIGDCAFLTEEVLREAVQALPQLRHLVMHGQTSLGQDACKRALQLSASSGELRSFASWPLGAHVQRLKGQLPVPGAGGRSEETGACSMGMRRWPKETWHGAAEGTRSPASLVPASEQVLLGRHSRCQQRTTVNIPGELFFAGYPFVMMPKAGPASSGGFLLTRLGDILVPHPVPEAA
ncbi:hypothetical protein CEUSTIGMA_g284.t1 [Chlamydomonas eustigma]|uniref:F-box domain-containing protein n=1 Tax=Chlamydomonas eustigma TaxID=1157962 RepID=A0A250WQ57_9CHLO|nr:hypothetical protein CEUSTIGMA_g284.t1 [Chlamydomonas eustigma]|eukprot:GAX72829.1 hypothetical protein CEUSTIGMA_g284.t1 [Chlamydomonas eustigma]